METGWKRGAILNSARKVSQQDFELFQKLKFPRHCEAHELQNFTISLRKIHRKIVLRGNFHPQNTDFFAFREAHNSLENGDWVEKRCDFEFRAESLSAGF